MDVDVGPVVAGATGRVVGVAASPVAVGVGTLAVAVGLAGSAAPSPIVQLTVSG
jgi:hypothetical protein